jgi:hypothetical protein
LESSEATKHLHMLENVVEMRPRRDARVFADAERRRVGGYWARERGGG